jgi:hypothetical protein
MKLNEFEAIELAAHVLDMPEYYEEEDVIDAIGERYGIDLETWQLITGTLIKMTPIVESPLTKTKYHAFLHNGMAIAKVKADGQGEE